MIFKTKARIRGTDGDLSPWIIHSARCDWCNQRATYLVDASKRPTFDGESIYLGGMAGITREVVCPGHLEERMAAVGESAGGGSFGAPIKQRWSTWLTMLPGVRRVDRWWNALEWDWPHGDGPERLAPWRWAWRATVGESLVLGVALTRKQAIRQQQNPAKHYRIGHGPPVDLGGGVYLSGP